MLVGPFEVCPRYVVLCWKKEKNNNRHENKGKRNQKGEDGL